MCLHLTKTSQSSTESTHGAHIHKQSIRVSMHRLLLPETKSGLWVHLCPGHHFTCFAQVYPTENKSEKTAADKIFQDFVPERLHHDQGKESVNSLFSRLQQLAGVGHSHTTQYYLQGIQSKDWTAHSCGWCKRKKKSQWKEPPLHNVHAYNCTRHEATDFSPFFLL